MSVENTNDNRNHKKVDIDSKRNHTPLHIQNGHRVVCFQQRLINDIDINVCNVFWRNCC